MLMSLLCNHCSSYCILLMLASEQQYYKTTRWRQRSTQKNSNLWIFHWKNSQHWVLQDELFCFVSFYSGYFWKQTCWLKASWKILSCEIKAWLSSSSSHHDLFGWGRQSRLVEFLYRPSSCSVRGPLSHFFRKRSWFTPCCWQTITHIWDLVWNETSTVVCVTRSRF